jgi:hypothetical protein
MAMRCRAGGFSALRGEAAFLKFRIWGRDGAAVLLYINGNRGGSNFQAPRECPNLGFGCGFCSAVFAQT